MSVDEPVSMRRHDRPSGRRVERLNRLCFARSKQLADYETLAADRKCRTNFGNKHEPITDNMLFHVGAV